MLDPDSGSSDPIPDDPDIDDTDLDDLDDPDCAEPDCAEPDSDDPDLDDTDEASAAPPLCLEYFNSIFLFFLFILLVFI